LSKKGNKNGMTHLFWGAKFHYLVTEKTSCHQIVEMFFWGKKKGPKYSHISRGGKVEIANFIHHSF
jgi:hypothetical protein